MYALSIASRLSCIQRYIQRFIISKVSINKKIIFHYIDKFQSTRWRSVWCKPGGSSPWDVPLTSSKHWACMEK